MQPPIFQPTLETAACQMKDKSRPGFTLIELLVVIVIIAILAALIFPVVGRIRQKGWEAKGLEHIRQLGTGALAVTYENNNQLPRYVASPASARWDRQVNAYLTGRSPDSDDFSPIFRDPLADALNLVPKDRTRHFSILAGITKGPEAGPVGLRPYRNLLRYNKLSRQIYLTDSGVTNGNMAGDLYAVDGGQFNWEGANSVNGDVSSAGDTPIKPGDGEMGNIRWYDGAAKFFFLDGHVERRKQEEVLRYNVNPLYP